MGWGGQENRILQESIGLKKRGVRVIILCQPYSIISERASADGIEIRTHRLKKAYDIFAIKRILSLIKVEKIDIVNTHSGKDSFLAGIAGRISKQKPLIVRTRHLALPITSRFTYSYLPHVIVTVSEYVRQYLIKENISPQKIVAIPTGIDTNKFDPWKTNSNLREEVGIAKDILLAGTISILRRKKGHHLLLDAIPLVLRKIPEALFLIVGDGPQKGNISNKVRDMGLSEKVILLGMREDIPNILKSIDIFVLPTLQEALGTSFLEAMAMEKPVIGFNIDGVKEVIKHGLNGYLVESGNPVLLADAIVDLFKNREKVRTMGYKGREMILKDFTADKMCERAYSLYLTSLKEKR